MILEINLSDLKKAEKRIWIKPTAKRIGHWRNLKGKPRFAEREERATKMITDFENVIKDQSYETCGAFDEYGSLVFTKDGEKDCVRFTSEEKDKFKATRFTHNHPVGYSFSEMDIYFACRAEMKEIRVTSRKNKTYSMKMKDGSNFSHDVWRNHIGPSFAEHDKSVRKYFTGKINTGLMSPKEATEKHHEEVWSGVADDLNNLIIYTTKVNK